MDSVRTDTSRWMWVAAAGIGLLYLGSTLLTPLYPLYEREFGFSELVVSEIYAVYVVGNLFVLFLFGRLSDQIGRRPATSIALAITTTSAILFLVASGAAWLFGARVLQGFAAGLGAAALTAWITELDPSGDRVRAAAAASAGNLAGLAAGALIAGVLAEYARWPLRLSYVVYIVALAAAVVTLHFAPETVGRRVHRVRELSLRPRIGIPAGLRLAFIAPAAMAFAAFSLGGFYAALVPGLMMTRLHETNLALIGGIVALFFGVAAATVIVSRNAKSRTAMLVSLPLLLIGLALLVLAESARSLPAALAATLATGAAMALGYRGSLAIVNEIAPEERRAELVSSYLLVCYAANSVPVIGVGLLSQAIGAENAHRAFAAVLAALAVLAIGIGLRYLPRR